MSLPSSPCIPSMNNYPAPGKVKHADDRMISTLLQTWVPNCLSCNEKWHSSDSRGHPNQVALLSWIFEKNCTFRFYYFMLGSRNDSEGK